MTANVIQDRAIAFMKAHPRATKAFCKSAELVSVGAGAGTVAVLGATAASADETTTTVDISVANTVVDTLIAACKDIVSSTYTKGIGILAVIMACGFGIRKIRSWVGA